MKLLIQPSGAKSWALRFRRPSGKPAKLTLGPFDPMGEMEGEPTRGAPLTLAAARKLATHMEGIFSFSGEELPPFYLGKQYQDRRSPAKHSGAERSKAKGAS